MGLVEIGHWTSQSLSETRGQGPDGRGRHAPSVLAVSVGMLTPVLVSVDPACSADPVVIEDLHGRTLSG